MVPNAWLSSPPRMPAFVRGVLNLGGAAVPVLRLDRLLGLPETAFGLNASILIMKAGSSLSGLLVERVEGVQPAADFQSLPFDGDQSLQGCIAGQLQGPLQQVTLLSWRNILLREEQARLDEFSHQIQDRLAELTEGVS